MVINALNGVWSDVYILQIMIQQKLTKILQDNFILKTQNFLSKLEIFTKLKRRIVTAILFLVMKIRKKYPIYVSKIFSKDMFVYY